MVTEHEARESWEHCRWWTVTNSKGTKEVVRAEYEAELGAFLPPGTPVAIYILMPFLET